jgi:hypothetical protein
MCRCDLVSSRRERRWFRSLVLGLLTLTVLLAAAAVSLGQDDPPPAVLKPGDDLPGPFRPWTFSGKHVQTLRRRIIATIKETDDPALKDSKTKRAEAIKGMFHCPLSEHGLNPVAMIFVKGAQPSDNLIQLLTKLDEAVPRREKERLAVVVVFLDENIKDVTTDDQPRNDATAALEAKVGQFANVTAAVDSFEALKTLYKLNPEADVTLLLFDKLRVASVKTAMNPDLDEKAVNELVKQIEDRVTAGPPPSPVPLKRPPSLGEK